MDLDSAMIMLRSIISSRHSSAKPRTYKVNKNLSRAKKSKEALFSGISSLTEGEVREILRKLGKEE